MADGRYDLFLHSFQTSGAVIDPFPLLFASWIHCNLSAIPLMGACAGGDCLLLHFLTVSAVVDKLPSAFTVLQDSFRLPGMIRTGAQRRKREVFRGIGARKICVWSPLLAYRIYKALIAASHQKIRIHNAAFLIVPRSINQVPDAILHLDIIPHMRFLISAAYGRPYDQGTVDSELLRQNTERLRIALADDLIVLNKHSRRCVGVIILSVFHPAAYIVMNGFQNIISVCFTLKRCLNPRYRCGYGALEGPDLSEGSRIFFLRHYGNCFYGARIDSSGTGEGNPIGVFYPSKPESLRVIITESVKSRLNSHRKTAPDALILVIVFRIPLESIISVFILYNRSGRRKGIGNRQSAVHLRGAVLANEGRNHLMIDRRSFL